MSEDDEAKISLKLGISDITIFLLSNAKRVKVQRLYLPTMKEQFNGSFMNMSPNNHLPRQHASKHTGTPAHLTTCRESALNFRAGNAIEIFLKLSTNIEYDTMQISS